MIINKKTNRLAKLFRVITIPPIIALVLMSIMLFMRTEVIGGFIPYLLSIFFLSIFPLFAYPLQPYLPFFAKKGRKGQRDLSIYMSIAGYLLGFITSIILMQERLLQVIYLTYFFSVVIIAFSSKVLKFNASGHTCGLLGPLAVLYYIFGSIALLGTILIPLVFWSSLKLHRHNIIQLVAGSIIPVIIFYLLIL